MTNNSKWSDVLKVDTEKVLNGLQKWNTLALAKIDALERQDLIFILKIAYDICSVVFFFQLVIQENFKSWFKPEKLIQNKTISNKFSNSILNQT